MKKKFCIVVFSVILIFPYSGRSEQNTAINISDIINNLQTEFSLINDYSVRLTAVVDMKNVRVPPGNIKMYFKQPDKVHLESKSFAMLPKEGIIINPNQFNKEDYYMSFLGEEILRGDRTYKIELVPRNDSIKIRKLNLWVDPDRWLVIRALTISWQGQSVQVDIQYDMINGKQWMPVKAAAMINLKGFMGFSSFHGGAGSGESRGDGPDESAGMVFLEFYDYEINKGIPDSMFTE